MPNRAVDARKPGVGASARTGATHCPYCALQCGMTVAPAGEGADGATVTISPRDDVAAGHGGPSTEGPAGGGLCQKGWTAGDLLTTAGRLTTPLLRDERGAPLRAVGWGAALSRVTAEIQRVQARYGRNAVAVFGGGGLTNEKAYQLGKFARVALRTANIDYNGRFCMSSAAAAADRAFGLDRGLPFPLEDVAAAEVVFLAGANVAETMPPFLRHLRDPAGTRTLIVADPRRTPTAAPAGIHLQLTPGTDLALANGLLHLALVEGLADEAYIAARTSGFAAVRDHVLARYWPERVERITGVPVPALREAVRALAAARTAIILTGRGAEQHATGTDTVTAFINLALALGLPGRPGSGYGALTGQGNGQGGREHGQKADQLPGYRRIDDPAARAHVAAVWGVDPADLPGPGRSATELLAAAGTPGGPRALLLFGSNPVISAPGGVADALDRLDFLAAADFVDSETARRADVLLPVTQWAEEAGTMTNLEGRVRLRRRCVDPPPGVRTDLEVLAELAGRLGAAGFSADPAAVFDELARASAGGIADYAGMSHARIDADWGLFWPCPDAAHPGTPRPFTDRFAHPDGRARFTVAGHRGPAESPDTGYPLYLTTGRQLAQYQSGAQTRRVADLLKTAPGPYAEIHPDLAARHDVADGTPVRLTTRRGTITVPARLTSAIRADTVFVPFHWPGAGRANTLTNPALDPVSRMPEFKVCAVHLERAGPPGTSEAPGPADHDARNPATHDPAEVRGGAGEAA
ncbi:MAG: molybdopterin-dependent oxidoreductase [Streptosporangiales bacterium]|nr:molybdopterin-dependent oxidoreductase [Streptosporangiales bacterium]